MLELVVSPLGTLWFQMCNQATEWGSTYARISAENFMTSKKDISVLILRSLRAKDASC